MRFVESFFFQFPCADSLIFEQNADDIFRKIYKDADPDTKRAMVKSLEESNGTVLNMNWKEVGARKVETSPPEGMEFRKWNAA